VNVRGVGGMTGDKGSSRDGCGIGDGYFRSIGEGGNRGDSATLGNGG
jgi:hypothetical protein